MKFTVMYHITSNMIPLSIDDVSVEHSPRKKNQSSLSRNIPRIYIDKSSPSAHAADYVWEAQQHSKLQDTAINDE